MGERRASQSRFPYQAVMCMRVRADGELLYFMRSTVTHARLSSVYAFAGGMNAFALFV